METWNEYTRFFTALLALTEGYSELERNRVARITTFTVTTFLILVALTGKALLHEFSNPKVGVNLD